MNTMSREITRTVESGPTSILAPSVSGIEWRSNYEIGSGVSALTGFVFAQSAMKPTSVKPATSQSYFFRKLVISTEDEYKRDIAVGASGSYNFGGVKVSGSASYKSSVTYSETSMTVIAQCLLLDNSYELMETAELTDEAAGLLASDPAKFRKVYGEYYIIGKRSGSQLNVVFTCKTTSSTSLQKFKASVEASNANLFSASGYTDFTSQAAHHGVSTSMSVYFGALKTDVPPPSDGTPADFLGYFQKNYALAPQEAELVIYPGLDRSIDVSPVVFGGIATLYETMMTVHNRFDTAPGDYTGPLSTQKSQLMNEIEVAESSLATDPSLITNFMTRLADLDTALQAIFDRFDLYQIAVGGRRGEPPQNQNVNMPNAARLVYGVTVSPTPDTAPVAGQSQHIKTGHGIGHHTANFNLGSSNQTLLVGFSVTQNRGSHGGHWVITSPAVILENTATIQIGSDYDRAADYTVEWFTVPSSDYRFGTDGDSGQGAVKVYA